MRFALEAILPSATGCSSAVPSTVRHGVADYAIRTFMSNDAREPVPPAHVVALCCHRVAAVRTDNGGVDFVELPNRNMQWAPIAVRGDAGIFVMDLPTLLAQSRLGRAGRVGGYGRAVCRLPAPQGLGV